MKKRKLLDEVRAEIRLRQMSLATEKNYVLWIRRYILFHKKRHPREVGPKGVPEFLTFLAESRDVAAATQNQALNALVFLYREVLEIDLNELRGIKWVKRPPNLPTVLTKEEVASTIQKLSGVQRLIAILLYGSGLRLTECIKLRVKDIDFDRRQITIRNSKGNRSRVVMLPEAAIPSIKAQLKRTAEYHKRDLKSGNGGVELPNALERKYPNAQYTLGWKFVFASYKLSKDPRSGIVRRHHVYHSILQKQLKAALKKAGITKHVTAHTFRHSFATHLLEDGADIRTVQELLGHRKLQTTMVYTHVLNNGPSGVKSPADRLRYQRKAKTQEKEIWSSRLRKWLKSRLQSPVLRSLEF